MLHKLSFFIRFLIWIGVITFFVYYPGEVRVQWLDYDVHTSVFFLFLVLFVVDKVMGLFGRAWRFLFHDLGKDVAISRYKAEIKSLKKKSKKQIEADRREAEDYKRLKAEARRQKWRKWWQKFTSLFRK